MHDEGCKHIAITDTEAMCRQGGADREVPNA